MLLLTAPNSSRRLMEFSAVVPSARVLPVRTAGASRCSSAYSWGTQRRPGRRWPRRGARRGGASDFRLLAFSQPEKENKAIGVGPPLSRVKPGNPSLHSSSHGGAGGAVPLVGDAVEGEQPHRPRPEGG